MPLPNDPKGNPPAASNYQTHWQRLVAAIAHGNTPIHLQTNPHIDSNTTTPPAAPPPYHAQEVEKRRSSSSTTVATPH